MTNRRDYILEPLGDLLDRSRRRPQSETSVGMAVDSVIVRLDAALNAAEAEAQRLAAERADVLALLDGHLSGVADAASKTLVELVQHALTEGSWDAY